MDLNQKITFPDTVFSQEVDGEMVLLDMNSECYFGLDSVGADFWKAIEEKQVLSEALEQLTTQYEAAPDVLEQDLLLFVEKLHKSGLIKVELL